jgi:hypothetical protein
LYCPFKPNFSGYLTGNTYLEHPLRISSTSMGHKSFHSPACI